MQGYENSSIPPATPPGSKARNVFPPDFLKLLGERDEPPTAGEADVAGPWRLEEIPSFGWGLFREGESLARGFVPAAVFPDRWPALIAAAVMPGTGREPLFHLEKEANAEAGGFAVKLDLSQGGETVGHLQLFDDPLILAMNVAAALLRSPQSLAYLVEAAGQVALERMGAILESLLAQQSS